jgi:heme/copper-type cytochrome/quinol oxidase subunit 2
MPIAIEVVSKEAFEAWVAKAKGGDYTSPAMAAMNAPGATRTAQVSN